MGLFTRRIDWFRKKKTIVPEETYFKFLKNGEIEDMNKDASGGPINYDFVVPDGYCFYMKQLIIAALNATIQMDNFVGLAPLANGMTSFALDKDDNVIADFTNGSPITTTLGIALFTSSSLASVIDRAGQGEDGFTMIVDSKENIGEEMFLTEGQKFRVTIADNLTEITFLRMMMKGILLKSI